MDYKLVKLQKHSGKEASIYSVYLVKERRTLFDRFVSENKNLFLSDMIPEHERIFSS
jgi:hypothetical protein